MNVMLIGDGGREEALAYVLNKSAFVRKLFRVSSTVDFATLLRFTDEKAMEFTIVGPEAPLVNGIVDVFERQGKRIFGPRQAGAMLEGSKVFCKELLRKYSIPTADFWVFDDPSATKDFIKSHGVPLVIKADGLAAGKGVVVASDLATAFQAVDRIMATPAGRRIVVEEYLEGTECSYMVFTDGKNFVPLRTVRDYKEAYPGGPMTGGMGCISPVPEITQRKEKEIQESIIKPILRALASEGIVYRGVLYAGLMMATYVIKVLELNCRLGDLETQVTVPFISSPDILPLLYATTHENGLAYHRPLEYSSKAAACIVIASQGYPETPPNGYPEYPIAGIEQARKLEGVHIFHAGTKHPPYEYITAGGRVVNVVGTEESGKLGISRAYEGAKLISFPGSWYRKDINF